MRRRLRVSKGVECVGRFWDPVWYDYKYGACHTFNGLTVERKFVDGKCEGPGCQLFQVSVKEVTKIEIISSPIFL